VAKVEVSRGSRNVQQLDIVSNMIRVIMWLIEVGIKRSRFKS